MSSEEFACKAGLLAISPVSIAVWVGMGGIEEGIAFWQLRDNAVLKPIEHGLLLAAVGLSLLVISFLVIAQFRKRKTGLLAAATFTVCLLLFIEIEAAYLSPQQVEAAFSGVNAIRYGLLAHVVSFMVLLGVSSVHGALEME